MSNEELVMMIQNGKTDLIDQLWEQIEKLIRWKARQILILQNGGTVVEMDDLVNSGYVALMQAVKAFDIQKGSFSNWFLFYLRSAFASVLGYRTKQGKNEPIRYAISLSMPLGEDEDSGSMADIVPDPYQTEMLEWVDEKLWLQDLGAALDKVVSGLPSNGRDIINRRFYNCQTFQEIAHELGISATNAELREKKALRMIRRSKHAKALIPFYDFNFYSGVGLNNYIQSGASVQEIYLMRLEEQAERERQRKRQQAWENKNTKICRFMLSSSSETE